VAKAEWARTTKLIDAAVGILAEEYPMTIRQLFYRLVSAGLLENNRAQYQLVSRIMTKARDDGRVEYEWLVDRSRPEYKATVFDDAAEYAEAVKQSYRKDYWATQPNHVEIWVEKDSIIGSIEPTTKDLGVVVRVGRGFVSTTRVHEIAEHFNRTLASGKSITVFYLGDWDPSGANIETDVENRVRAQGSGDFHMERLAIFKRDIRRFKLPPLRVKDTDPRSAAFAAEYGKDCVELDALPPDELRRRINNAVNDLIDHDLWDRAIAVEKVEIKSILDSVALWKTLPKVSAVAPRFGE
jgi:hypothetical protein